jgi:3-dehydroquinate synthetase
MVSPEHIVQSMTYDKKMKEHINYFILTKDIGSVTVAPVADPVQALRKLE